jgi:hypothetical protein
MKRAGRSDVVWLAVDGSLMGVALNRVVHLRGSEAPSLSVFQGRGEQFVDQACHGQTQALAFMIQCADNHPVDAGRVMCSP